MIEPINGYVVIEVSDEPIEKVPLSRTLDKKEEPVGFLDIPKKPKKAARGLSADEKFTVKKVLAWQERPDMVGRSCIVEEVMVETLPGGIQVIKQQYIVGILPEDN